MDPEIKHKLSPDLPQYPAPPKSYKNKSLDAILGWTNIITHVGKCAEQVGPAKDALPPDCLKFTPEKLTYLKLLLVGSYAKNAFLRIAGKRPRPLYYLDVLSASGIAYRRSNPDPPIAGSAFLTPLAMFDFKGNGANSGPTFSEVHCFDYSADNLSILAERRDGLATAGFPLPPYHYHAGDANNAVREVIEQIQERDAQIPNLLDRSLSLVFVDNQAMNISMETIQFIPQGIRGDLLVYIPVSAAWRNIQAQRKTGNNAEALDAFFGSGHWQNVEGPADIAPLYHEIIQEHTEAPLQEFSPVTVRGERSEFALAIYARQTSGTRDASGWMSSIESLASKCNDVDLDEMQSLINRAVHRQQSLFDHF